MFADLVRLHQRMVFSTALRLSRTTPDAEDLASETFLRAYAALRRYSADQVEELQVRPWLVTILLNLWRNQLRLAARRPSSTALPVDSITPPGTSPEDAAERQHDRDQLVVMLRLLPERQRVAVVLRHIAGLSYAEVAQTLRCPEGTAKSHVSRGVDRLRRLNHGEGKDLR